MNDWKSEYPGLNLDFIHIAKNALFSALLAFVPLSTHYGNLPQVAPPSPSREVILKRGERSSRSGGRDPNNRLRLRTCVGPKL